MLVSLVLRSLRALVAQMRRAAPDGADPDSPPATTCPAAPEAAPKGVQLLPERGGPSAGGDVHARRLATQRELATLIAATRLGSGPAGGRQLSRRAARRLESDPFVRRLTRLG